MLDRGGSDTKFFGVPSPGPRFLLKDGDEDEDELATKPFEYEFERVQEQERSRRNSVIDGRAVAAVDPAFLSTLRFARRRSSGGAGAGAESAGTSDDGEKPPAGPADLPVELWQLIFNFLALDIDDDSYQPVGDLFSCALTCRVCTPPFGEQKK